MKTPCSFNEWSDCFCNTPPTLNNIRRGFVTLAKYCFSNPDNYSDNKDILGCLKYSDDPKERDITVVAKGAQDPTDTQLVPGVFISLADQVQFTNFYIGDARLRSRDTASRTSSLQATANVAIRCSHKNADICCAMSDMCLLFFMAAIPHIKNAWGWVQQINIVSQSEPKLQQLSESDTSNKYYESVLVIQLIYQYSINIDIESKRLKAYTLDNNSYLNF